jgi:hypothetical protein
MVNQREEPSLFPLSFSFELTGTCHRALQREYARNKEAGDGEPGDSGREHVVDSA